MDTRRYDHAPKTIFDLPLADIPLADMAHFQLEMHKKHSTFRFMLGDRIAISTTDIVALKKHAQTAEKPAEMYHFLQPLLGKVIFHDIEQTKKRRNFELKHISANLVETNFDFFSQLLDQEIAEWLRLGKQNNGIVSIQDRLKTLSMRMTIAWACGKDFPESEKLAFAFHAVLAGFISLQHQSNSELEREVNSHLDYIKKTVGNFVNERRSIAGLKSENRIYLDELISISSKDDALDELITLILLAGYHTTAASSSWVLYALSQHPDIAKKVHDEIDMVIHHNLFDYSMLAKLPYLSKVIRETLRRYTPGPYTVRETDQESEIDDYVIPPKTMVFYPIWAVHMDPLYWHQPEKFDPDRRFNLRAYFPFGLGARNCTGQTMANAEILLIISKIMQKIVIKAAPNFNPEPADNFVLISKNGMELNISPRKENINKNIIAGCAGLGTFALTSALNISNDKRLSLIIAFIVTVMALYYSDQLISKRDRFFKKNIFDKKSEATPQVSFRM
ncbi:MAG: hypothetical protein A3F11_04630 [Gammaproteobacteria bacterium RIFCSPHIGHO2_12_FULL_37_14]|nr:MAG: hypothetical protein A3F11_04630 [Gammaproteobacteria bacterium RIFCSPHIGHO2_12_FULL_37_14]